MDGIEPEKKNKLISIVRWAFGALFLIICAGAFLETNYITSLLFILAAIVTIPPAATELEKKLNVHMSGIVRFFVVFIIITLAMAASPNAPTTTPTVNNSTGQIAAPPATVSGSDAVAVPSAPAQAATPTETPTPEVKPTPTETPTIEVKPTKTLADKEPDSNSITTDTPTPSKTSAPEVTSIETPTTEPTPTPRTAQIIAKWTGNGIKNTETFHVSSNEWIIAWDTRSGQYGDMNFIITVYNSDGSYKESAANVIGSSNDHTIIRGSGDYYLNINTAQPYTIQIEE